jgi:WD40 repeat protein
MRIAADVESFVYLWEAETGKLLFAIDSGQGQRIWNPGHDLTFSVDGRRIAVSSHQAGAIILNGETGQRLVSIKDDRTVRGVGDIAFSPDDSQVVLTLSDGFVGLYDAIDGRFLSEFQSSIQQDINLPIVRSAAFNRDGTKAAAGGNYWPRRGPPEGFVSVWDIGVRSEDFTLTGHSTSVRRLAFSPDDTHIMTVGGESVRIWDARDGAALSTLRPDCSGIAYAAYQSVANRIAIVCEEGTVHDCVTATGHCTVIFSRSLSGMDAIVSTGIHPDGERIVMATLSGSLAIWNMRTGEKILKLRLPDPE